MNAATSPPVSLSVVVVALDGGANLSRFLEAIRGQQDAPAMETVVAHDDRISSDSFSHSFPEAKFVFCPVRRNYPALRSAGVRVSRGHIIAVTEDQCIPPPRWCANLLAAHAAVPHAAIGGPVEKRAPDSLFNWAVYLREFGDYIPPLREGRSPHLTDCNVTYKRAALDAIASVWEKEFHEPHVHGALRARGETLWLSPALVTDQQRSFSFWPALAERFRFGRLYAALCLPTLSAGKRFILAVASPLLLPFLLLFRTLAHVLRRRRHIGMFLATLPFLALLSVLWSWGEFTGYLTGRRSKDLDH